MRSLVWGHTPEVIPSQGGRIRICSDGSEAMICRDNSVHGCDFLWQCQEKWEWRKRLLGPQLLGEGSPGSVGWAGGGEWGCREQTENRSHNEPQDGSRLRGKGAKAAQQESRWIWRRRRNSRRRSSMKSKNRQMGRKGAWGQSVGCCS